MRALLVLLAAASAVTAAAQPTLIPTLLYEINSPHPRQGGYFGGSLAAVGDLDGDGTTDLAVGAPNEAVGAVNPQGRAYLVSGATGAILRELVGQPDLAALFGDVVAGVGDLDGDGTPDVAVGATNEGPDEVENGAAYAFSGATGARLYRRGPPDPFQYGSFGRALVGPGDLTGDGVPDVVVFGGGSEVHLYTFSGAAGTLAQSFELGAVPLVAAGDVDGDGVPDIAGGGGMAEEPRLYRVISGATGAELLSLTDPEGGGGTSIPRLASAGDLNGDGLPEMAVAALASGTPGRVVVFDGATGAVVRQIAAPAEVPAGPFTFPRGMATGDADGDGIPDLVVGAFDSTNVGGAVYVFSGATGAILAGPFSEAGGVRPASAFGETLAFVREAEGTNPAVLAIGSYTADPVGGPLNVGRVYVFALGGTVASEPSPEGSGLSVSVSPNPSAGAAAVALTVAEASSVRVAVLDALGRTVAVLHDGPVSVGVQRLALPSALAPGVYAVVAEGGAGRASARWVVAR